MIVSIGTQQMEMGGAELGDLLIGKLPAVRNARQERHAAFIAVEQVNLALLRKLLELGQTLVLQLVHVRIGCVL